jgi:HEAT repeat protein
MKRLFIVIGILVLSLGFIRSIKADETKTLKEYIDTLTDRKEPADIRDAFQGISRFEPKTEEQIDILIDVIRHGDENVSHAAQQSLMNVQDNSLVPKLISVLETGGVKRTTEKQAAYAMAKAAAINALRKLKDKRAVPALKNYLDEDEFISNRASLALAEIGDESVIPDLLARIGKHNAPTGLGLARFGAPALKEIVKRLESEKSNREPVNSDGENEYVRMKQVIALIRDPAAVPDLLLLLKEPDVNIRIAAIQSLGNMGHLNIAEAIKDEDSRVRLNVVELSRKIDDTEINSILMNVFCNDNNNNVRVIAADVLSERKCYEAVPIFEDALENEAVEVRVAAKRALERIRSINR